MWDSYNPDTMGVIVRYIKRYVLRPGSKSSRKTDPFHCSSNAPIVNTLSSYVSLQCRTSCVCTRREGTRTPQNWRNKANEAQQQQGTISLPLHPWEYVYLLFCADFHALVSIRMATLRQSRLNSDGMELSQSATPEPSASTSLPPAITETTASNNDDSSSSSSRVSKKLRSSSFVPDGPLVSTSTSIALPQSLSPTNHSPTSTTSHLNVTSESASLAAATLAISREELLQPEPVGNGAEMLDLTTDGQQQVVDGSEPATTALS